jgi:hypothetical protein
VRQSVFLVQVLHRCRALPDENKITAAAKAVLGLE